MLLIWDDVISGIPLDTGPLGLVVP